MRVVGNGGGGGSRLSNSPARDRLARSSQLGVLAMKKARPAVADFAAIGVHLRTDGS